MRHMHGATFDEAANIFAFGLKATMMNRHLLQEMWKPCRDWECPFCHAMNDDEDDRCEICRIEPRDRNSSRGGLAGTSTSQEKTNGRLNWSSGQASVGLVPKSPRGSSS